MNYRFDLAAAAVDRADGQMPQPAYLHRIIMLGMQKDTLSQRPLFGR